MSIINDVEEKMKQALERLNHDFERVQTGRANPHMLDRVRVEAYGEGVPLNQVALISVPEARQLMIKPFDPSLIKEIEKGILACDFGINPETDGTMIRLNIPQLTEEKRKEFAKDVKKYGEDAKIIVRNARKEGNNTVKKDPDLAEDEKGNVEIDIQTLTEKYNGLIEKAVKEKEDEVLKV